MRCSILTLGWRERSYLQPDSGANCAGSGQAACAKRTRSPRPRRTGDDRRGKLQDMRLIHDRPAELFDRKVSGHCGRPHQGASNRSAVTTLVERKTASDSGEDGHGVDAALEALTRRFDVCRWCFKCSSPIRTVLGSDQATRT
jgi:IS30 family transposase